MTDATKPLPYDPADPDRMKLPTGTTCGDCRHISRCKAIFGHVETDVICDWSPSRFSPAASAMDRPVTETEHLAEDLRRDYLSVRVLPDGSIAALYPLTTTTSVVLGCTRDGWSSRFCFRDPALALQRFNEVQSEDDWLEGSIAQRGRAQLRPESMRKSP